MARNKNKAEFDNELLTIDEGELVDKVSAEISVEDTPNYLENPNNSDTENPGIFVYLGPTIRGVITKGSIFSGTRSDILNRFEKAVGEYPEIKRLIIPDSGVAKARELLSKGEGAISVTYKKLSENIK